MRIDTSGNLGIGTTSTAGLNLRVSKSLTPGADSGATDVYGVRVDGNITSAATGTGRLYSTYPSTAASAFTLANLVHYQANQGTLGAGSAVTTQIGFSADTGLVGATSNYGFLANDIGGALATTGKTNIGFYSNLSTASGGGSAYNIYSAGTALNYFGGNVGIGTTSASQKLQVTNGNIYISTTNWLMWDPNGNFGIQSDASTRLSFFCSSGTERMRIDSSGNVGIGTTSISTNFRQEIVGLAGSNTSAATTGTTQAASAVMRIRPGGGFTGTLDIGQGGGTGSWIQSTDTANLATTYPLLLNPVGGNVGIGTSSPSYRLSVVGPSNDYRTAIFESGSTNGPSVQIKGSKIYELRSTNTGATEGSGLFFIYDKDNEASRLTINSSGVTAIKFAATQVASADANTLDDYEEGTFTPNLVNNGTSSTFSAKDGWYRKIGSVVHYWVRFDGGNSGTSGTQLQIVNLPFTFLSGTSAAQVGGVYSSNSPLSATGSVNPQGNTNYANIYSGGNATTAQATYLSAQITAMTTS